MGRLKKAGESGIAANYITREQAIRRLQVTLKDFRRLCILKGIYPRDPKKKASGRDKTYYHKKDILYLHHEPLLAKFRDFKIYLRKRKRLMQRYEHGDLARLDENKPVLTLDHLVRERYPAFVDALRDLDDPLSMVHLFAELPSNTSHLHSPQMTEDCTRLSREFRSYIVREQCLRKVFISIKGIYYQAEVQGETITWLVPHKFGQKIPKNVDFRVMLTFLEFYMTMIRFVNFKLFHDIGLMYPPSVDVLKESAGHAISSLSFKREDADAEEDDLIAKKKGVFDGLVFMVPREVPAEMAEFIILSGGGRVVRCEDASKEELASVTHVLVDRPNVQQEENKEYIQPQWLADSFNIGRQLPVYSYAPGAELPPHLSPFVDDEVEGYVPQQRRVLNEWAGQTSEAGEESGDNGGEDIVEENVDSEEEADDLAENAQDGIGVQEEDDEEEEVVVVAGCSKKRKKADIEDDQQAEELAKIMMSNKDKRLYSRMQHGIQKKKEAARNLENKRRKLAAAKKKKRSVIIEE